MDLKILDGRKQGLIVLEHFVNLSKLLVKYPSVYWTLTDSYKGTSGSRDAFKLSFFIIFNDIHITQKYTLVSAATLGVFFVRIIFANNILITQIDTLSEIILRSYL